MPTIEAHEVVCFRGGQILHGDSFVIADLWIANGKVVTPQSSFDREIDASPFFIVPGFIDIQCNGAFGIDFSLEPEQVEVVASQLPQYGVTAFLPTLVSSAKETYRHATPLLQPRQVLGGAEILGIHLEGPFIHPTTRGCHRLEYLRAPLSPADLLDCYGELSGVKIVTLAPELAGSLEAISWLHGQGIVISGGHSTATGAQALTAVDRGITLVTHLFNAMTPLHHREPGWVGVALTTPDLWYGCIADGVHISSMAVSLAWRAHAEGMILVTDAMAAMGLPSGTYTCGDVVVEVQGERAYVAGTMTLAGSITPMIQMVKNLCAFTGCSLADAARAASEKPAKALGIFPKKGSLDTGADADFVLLDSSLDIVATYLAGRKYAGF